MSLTDVNILVVEDEQLTSTYLARVLSVKNWRVDTAHDAARALALAREKQYDAVVLDAGTVGMDGADLCRRLLEVQPAVHGIFLAASPTINTIYAAVESGADRVLSKPVDPNELVRVLEDQLADEKEPGDGAR
jgi:DNA-binding response OmpR family regulator